MGYDFLVVCPGLSLDWDRLPPRKIAYLAADWWRMQGVLSDIHVVLVLPTPKMFGVPEFSAVLEKVAARSGIDMWLLKRYGLPFLYWNFMLKGRA